MPATARRSQRRGLRFTASLGANADARETRTLLLEVAEDGIKCSRRTGGDAWCFGDGVAGATHAPAPQKCSSWDRKGRNPAQNVYVHLGEGAAGACPGRSASGSDSDGGEEPHRCKLGLLVQHALPRLAERCGGWAALGLDWVTWEAEASGVPDVASVATDASAARSDEHWASLRELASSAPSTDAVEELALRRIKETLVEAARFAGPDAAAKVEALSVRKLYQREYHFFYGDQNVADSRRHALEWAIGLAEADRLLETNPEARAKLNEKLTGHGSSAGGPPRKRKRTRPAPAPGAGAGNRVLLSAAGGRPHGDLAGVLAGVQLGAQQQQQQQPQQQQQQQPVSAAASVQRPGPRQAALPGLPPLPPQMPQPLLPLAPEPAAAVAAAAAAALAASPRPQPAAAAAARRPPMMGAAPAPAPSADFADWLRQLQVPDPSSFSLGLGRPAHEAGGGGGPPLAAAAVAPHQALPAPAQPAASTASAARGQAGQAAAVSELVPLDSVLEAWERHDAVRRQLGEAQAALEAQAAQLAAARAERDALAARLAAAQAAQPCSGGLAAPAVAGGGSSAGSSPRGVLGEGCPPAAAAAAAKAAAASQLADLRALLPQGLTLQLSQLCGRHPELAPFAPTVCDVAVAAVQQALGVYGALAAGAPPPPAPGASPALAPPLPQLLPHPPPLPPLLAGGPPRMAALQLPA